ncbi:hypothetical protein ABEW34_21445 [Paenibacillus algorifonticola]|uniref:hypothetical protein n=1 Tax=Paenibacillus algorifonticola TaxID=684063 RepID=UPI003D2B855D
MAFNYVTVLAHRGLDICVASPATPDRLGYIIDHINFVSQTFSTVAAAVEAIDDYLNQQ